MLAVQPVTSIIQTITSGREIQSYCHGLPAYFHENEVTFAIEGQLEALCCSRSVENKLYVMV
jgi:hypothetical protein